MKVPKYLILAFVVPLLLSIVYLHIYNNAYLWRHPDIAMLASYVLSFGAKPIIRRFFRISNAQWSKTIQVEGLQGPVKIYRDSMGFPYIFAKNDEDMIFAQGYITALERSFQMNVLRLMGQGRLSEFLGEKFFQSDVKMRTLGMQNIAEKFLLHTDAVSLHLMKVYAKGATAGLQSLSTPQIEYKLLRVPFNTTWTAQDCALLQAMISLQLNRGWNIELSNLLIDEFLSPSLQDETRLKFENRIPFINPEGPKATFYSLEGKKLEILENASKINLFSLSHYLDELKAKSSFSSSSPNIFSDDEAAFSVPSNSFEATIFEDLSALNHFDGSNAWAISGNFTQSGKPLLAGDMHLMQTAPGAFFPIFLFANQSKIYRTEEESIRFIGASLPGTPGIVAGHNEYIATSMTVSYVDTDDLFKVKLTQDGKHYIYDGKVMPLDITEEYIPIKGEKYPRRVIVKRTHHGPLITSFPEFKSLAISNSTTEDLAFSSLLFRSDCGVEGITSFAARNWKEFFNSIAGRSCIHLVSTWADSSGNIGNFLLGGVPQRSSVGKSRIRDGSTTQEDWKNILPAASTPHYMNPKRGYVLSANSLLSPDPYDQFGYCFLPGHRQWRVKDLLEKYTMVASQNLRVEDFQRMQMDQFSINACDWKDILLEKNFSSSLTVETSSSASICEAFLSVDTSLVSSLKTKLDTWDCTISPQNTFSAFMEAWIELTVLQLFSNTTLFPKNVQKTIIDETSGSMFLQELSIHRRTTLIRLLKEDSNSVIISKLGGTSSILCKTLKHMFTVTRALYGTASVDLAWKDFRLLFFMHAITTASFFLQHTFSVGPYIPGGNFGTIFPSRSSISDIEEKLKNPRRIAVSAGPATRMVMDTGNWAASKWLMPPGVSGWVASQHYGDQLPYLMEGKLHPMFWKDEDILEDMVTEMTLI